jgi:transposase
LIAYSPDFNPIEMAFSKLKALLKKAAARTVTDPLGCYCRRHRRHQASRMRQLLRRCRL